MILLFTRMCTYKKNNGGHLKAYKKKQEMEKPTIKAIKKKNTLILKTCCLP